MDDNRIEAMILRSEISRREYLRASHASRLNWHRKTRDAVWTRGEKMSATMQLKKIEREMLGWRSHA